MRRIVIFILLISATATAQMEFTTIAPTPGMPTVGFANTYATGTEKDTPVRVQVISSQPIANDVTVNYNATGSAQNGADFSLADSTLTIPRGQTTTYIEFPVVNDVNVDGDESVKIILSNPQNAVLGQNIFTYVIKNNDADPDAAQIPPLLTMSPAGERGVALNLSQPYSADIASVGYQITLTQTGSNLNYTLGTGTVTFQRGQTRAILDIPKSSDDINVPDIKTITVFLNNPANVAIDIPMYSFSY